MIQALIFDFDGLILDTETPEVQIWQELFARYGKVFPIDEWVHSVVGAAIANLDPLVRLEQLTGLQLDRPALLEETHRTRLEKRSVLQPLPGVADYLSTARLLGLRLAIASSSPHARVDDPLRQRGFYELFDAIICQEDAPRVKPAPDLFLAALSALHVPADQALAFEDSPNGVRAAKAAGLRSVGVLNPITSLLGTLPADLSLASLGDIALPGLLSHFGDNLVIRPELPDDLPGIRAVNESAFRTKAEADLVDLCRQRGRIVLSLAAILDGQVIGHVLFTPVTLEPQDPGREDLSTGLGIGPLAVLPEFQHSGIGSRLMRAGLEQVCRFGCSFDVLLGNPAYYSRFGFKPGAALGLSSDYDEGDAFQVLELHPGTLAGVRGRIKYIPEFEESGC
jgi:HAD superfamily hydrolase (TIGR01509 family)